MTIYVPKCFMNLVVTSDNRFLIGDTNDSSKWETIKIPLPPGEWKKFHREGEIVIFRKEPNTG